MTVIPDKTINTIEDKIPSFFTKLTINGFYIPCKVPHSKFTIRTGV